MGDRGVSDDDRREAHEASEQQRREGAIGGLTTFNIEHGYVEALLRGFRSAFLKSVEYRALTQCESMDDVKLSLGDTDYSAVLSNLSKLTPEIILKRVEDKFIAEFFFLQSQAVGHLATFLDFITYEDLIKNISFVIKSLIHGADPNTLLDKCSRLGRSPHLRSVLTFEQGNAVEAGDGLLELYRTVLVDTPVAPYFEAYFNSEMSKAGGSSDAPQKEIARVYSESEVDVITNMIQRIWLEDFYRWTQRVGGETAVMMKELLEFEADRRAISIIINSFRTVLNEPSNRDSERKKLFCNFGKLYPECTLFKFSQVSDESALASALEPYKQYSDMLRSAQDGSAGKSLEDLFYEHEVRLCRQAFDGQSHMACFYAWVKLKRQEERNLKWILQMIHQKQDAKHMSKWIKIF